MLTFSYSLDFFNWLQFPLMYGDEGFNSLSQFSVGEGPALLYPPSIGSMDPWATFV
jgi:hypothetical protein